MKSLLWIFAVICNLAYARTSLPTLTAEQWRQDLGYFATEIRTKHRDPYHLVDETTFDQAVSFFHIRIASRKELV